MGWSDFEIQCGFGGEETTRFGPREESGSSLYQVDTTACIYNKSQSYGCPSLLSSSSTDRTAVVLDKNIVIFDEGCTEHQCSFSAESVIDVIAWSEDSSFLIYGDRGGCLSIAHLESSQVLFSKKVMSGWNHQKGRCFVSLILVEGNEKLYDVIVVTSNCMLYRFFELDLNTCVKAALEKNLELAAEMQKNIKVWDHNMKEYHEEIFWVEYRKFEKMLFVAGRGDYIISEWYLGETDNDVYVEDLIYPSIQDQCIVKCLVTPDDQYMILLDSQGHLSISFYKGFSFTLEEWSGKFVEDFNLFVTSSVDANDSTKSKPSEDFKIVLLTKPKPEEKFKELIVLSLPHLDHVYTLKIAYCAILALSPLQQETINFIEGVEDNLDDSCEEESLLKEAYNVTTVRVRSLIEAIPENRFSRLLHKRKFDEAEDFAKTFGIDVELVHKVRSSFLLDQLTILDCNSKKEEFDKKLNALKSCLDKIKDMEHVVSCCLHAELPTLEATYDLINYAREKVNFGDRKFTESSPLFQCLLDAINRFVTFQVAFGESLFSAATWSQFWLSPLCDEVIKCFKEKNMKSGIIIWRRHQCEFQNTFTTDKLIEVLDSIHAETPSCSFIPWLREDFVPYVLTVLPEGQCILADWLVDAARKLEFSEKEKWPDNALDLAEVMYKAFSNVSQSTQGRGVATPMQFATKICKLSIPYFDNTANQENVEENKEEVADTSMSHVNLSMAMKTLGNLVKNLREVKSLHYEYNCKLSLHEYQSEDSRSIAFRLLNRVAAAELIPQTIKKYVKPFARKNNLKLDQLLYEYINELVDLQSQVASMWETKVIAITKEIEKKEIQCQATLKLMLKAATPWSPEVEKLVAIQMETCPDNKKLFQQYEFAMLRKMMAQYSIKNVNIADMSRIEDIIQYMISTKKPTALTDALEISKHMPVVSTAYVRFLQIKYWIHKGKIEQMSRFIKEISCDEVFQIIQYILTWLKSIIQWKPVDEEDEKEQMMVTHATLLILTAYSRQGPRSCQKEVLLRLSELKCIFSLQNEFGIFVSFDDYCNDDNKKEIICSYIENAQDYCCKEVTEGCQKLTNKSMRLLRLASLLNLKDGQLEKILLENAKEKNNLNDIYEIACSIVKVREDEKYANSYNPRLKLLNRLAYILMTENNGEFPWVKMADDVYAFSAEALALCEESDMHDSLEMARLMRLVSVTAAQCESSDYQEENKKMEGLQHQWIEDQYKDDSLVVSSHNALQILRRIIGIAIKEPKSSTLQYESLRMCGRRINIDPDMKNEQPQLDIVVFSKLCQALVNLFKENNQHELAVHMLMFVLSTCLRHFASLCIHIPIQLEETANQEAEAEFLERESNALQLILSHGEKFLNESTVSLLKLVLSHRFVDHDLALCYLDIFPTKFGQQVLMEIKEKFNNKFTRIQTIAKIGVDFGALRNNKVIKDNFNSLKECAYWGRKLQLLRVPQQYNIYNVHVDATEKKRVLDAIVQHKDIDRQSILSFCESFGFDEGHALLKFIECQLLLKQENPKDTSYQEKVDDCIESYLTKMLDQSKLQLLLNTMVLKASPYDYEKLIYLFKKCTEISDKEDVKMAAIENVQLLELLYMYKKTASTSDYNFDMSMMGDGITEDQDFSTRSFNIPEHAKHRLPFHWLTKKSYQWNIINAELTSEQNVIKLEPIVRKLNIDTDQMFTKAVRNITEKCLKTSTTAFEFGLIEGILNKIEKHTVMIAAAKCIAMALPIGGEKARVSKAILDRAAQLLAANSQAKEAQHAVKMFTVFYKRSTIENALLEHGIKTQKFLELSSQASQLIIHLYEDFGDKVRFETGKLSGIPEIHTLAKAIADIEGIDLLKVQKYLTKKWLPCIRSITGSDDDADDDTMDLRHISKINQASKISLENEKNLRRAIYVLASCYNEDIIKMLLHFIYTQEIGSENGVDNLSRIRALQVMFTLYDVQTIQKFSQKPVSEINEKLVASIYLSELDTLHISQSEQGFIKSPKDVLVKGLWRNHSQQQQGIRLIADICMDYQIYDPQLWNNLLLKLQSFKMYDYLVHVLVHISGIPQLREIPLLTKIWRYVITAPFQSVSQPLTAEEEKSCSSAAQLLTRCPVILDIGLPDVANLMKKAGFYIQCMMCAKLIPDNNTKQAIMQTLLDQVGIDLILSKIKKARDDMGTDAHLDGIEEDIFNYVNDNSLYLSVAHTSYFKGLIEYLVRMNNINNLIVKLIMAKKMESVLDIIECYVNYHKASNLYRTVKESEMDRSQALMLYLNEAGLMNSVKPYLNHLHNDSSVLGDITNTTANSVFEIAHDQDIPPNKNLFASMIGRR